MVNDTSVDPSLMMGATEARRVGELLKGKRLLVLAGAGVSWDSGLPIANELRDEIFGALHMPADTKAVLGAANIPFELMVETLAGCSETASIRRIFQGGEPCGFHRLCAVLARIDELTGVLTTNFDGLFESAFAAAGVPLQRVWREKDLADWHPETARHFLLKLHGSAHNLDSLGITIRRVAGRRGVAARQISLRRAILASGADVILVAGYSGSDRFDINPALAALAVERPPPLVLVAHDPAAGGSAVVEPLMGNPLAGPFAGFEGMRVSCDTGRLVDLLAGCDLFEAPAQAADWKSHVSSWRDEAIAAHGPAIDPHLVGALLRAAAQYRQARDWFRRAIEVDGDEWLRIESLLSIARCERDVGENLGVARAAASRALRLSRRTGDMRGEIGALIELGVVAADEKRSRSALRYYGAAESLARRTNELEKVGIAVGNAAIVRKNLGGIRRLRRSLRDYGVSLEIAREVGDKRSEGRTIGNIGIVKAVLGDRASSLDEYRVAGSIARELGDAYHEAVWLVAEADDISGVEPARAIGLVLKARAMFDPLSAAAVRQCDEHLARFGHRPGRLEGAAS